MTIRSLLVACLILFAQHPGHAQETLATEASVRELMEVMDTPKMMDQMWAQVDSLMESSLKQSLSGQNVTPAQQVVLDDMQKELMALLSEEMSWAKLEPIMLDIYSKSFSETEVQSMLEFYKSPAGQAVIAKMPVVMQESMRATQASVASLQPKLRQLLENTTKKMKVASTQETGS